MTARRQQGGFTLVELMTAFTILVIGLAGLIGLVLVSLRASSYSRHATEAAVLCEDKLEKLRTQTVPGAGSEGPLDARGILDDENGVFTREWAVDTVILDPPFNYSVYDLRVTVSWEESEGGRQVEMHTERQI